MSSRIKCWFEHVDDWRTWQVSMTALGDVGVQVHRILYIDLGRHMHSMIADPPQMKSTHIALSARVTDAIGRTRRRQSKAL